MRTLFIFALFALGTFGINAQSTHALQLFEIGLEASAAGDHARALKNFSETLQIIDREGASEKFSAKVHYNLGVSNYHLQQREAAAAEYERAIKVAGGNYEKAHYALGLVNAELGRWDEAKTSFGNAVRLNDRNGEAWFDMAFTYLALNETENAKTAFRKAIKNKAVEKAISHNNLGVLLAVDGDLSAAAVEFEQAVSSSGGDLDVAVDNLNKCKIARSGSREFVARKEFELARREAKIRG